MYEMGVPAGAGCKVSGIGCSPRAQPILHESLHSFNAVHGRMPSWPRRDAWRIGNRAFHSGVAATATTASIGIGQFVHLMRRNLPIIYIIEDNGFTA